MTVWVDRNEQVVEHLQLCADSEDFQGSPKDRVTRSETRLGTSARARFPWCYAPDVPMRRLTLAGFALGVFLFLTACQASRRAPIGPQNLPKGH